MYILPTLNFIFYVTGVLYLATHGFDLIAFLSVIFNAIAISAWVRK